MLDWDGKLNCTKFLQLSKLMIEYTSWWDERFGVYPDEVFQLQYNA